MSPPFDAITANLTSVLGKHKTNETKTTLVADCWRRVPRLPPVGGEWEADFRSVDDLLSGPGARRSSVVRAFAHGAMGRRIDPLWRTH